MKITKTGPNLVKQNAAKSTLDYLLDVVKDEK